VKKTLITSKKGPKRTSRIKFLPISEEMKEWSALLGSELNSWPNISSKSMFGFLFFYRRKNVFAALPRTRGFDSPSTLVFKLQRAAPALLQRAQSDPRMELSMKASSKGWFSFRLNSEADIRDAVWWLSQAYEAAGK